MIYRLVYLLNQPKLCVAINIYSFILFIYAKMHSFMKARVEWYKLMWKMPEVIFYGWKIESTIEARE